MEKLERKPNPMKQLAMQLAHSMDDQERSHEMTDWDRKGVRECHNQICNEILKQGFNIDTIMRYAKEYKTLSMKDYIEWRYI